MRATCKTGRRDLLDIIAGIISTRNVSDTKKHYRRYVDLLVEKDVIRVRGDRILVSEKGRVLAEKIKLLKNIVEGSVVVRPRDYRVKHIDPYTFRETYIGFLSGGKARSKYDIIACILACGLKGSSRVHILETCSLNTVQFRKYMKILLLKKMIRLRKLPCGRAVIETMDLGRKYLDNYTHIIDLLKK